MVSIHETLRLELRNEIFIFFVSVETNGLGFFTVYLTFKIYKNTKRSKIILFSQIIWGVLEKFWGITGFPKFV